MGTIWRRLRRVSLTQWIVLSMIVGTVIGWLAPGVALHLQILSTLFLRMIKALIAPLIFGMLVVGIAGHGDDLKRVGRLAIRSIVYFEVITTLALAVGLFAVNVIKPGQGVNIESASTAQATSLASTHMSADTVLVHVVPQSIAESAANNEVLQIVFFAVLFGVAVTRVRSGPKQTMLAFCESLSEVMFKFTALVMAFAPFGIGGAIAYTVGKNGLGVLRGLGLLVGTLYIALIIFAAGVLWPVAAMARVPVRRFVNAIKEPWLIAFSTASSEAALPLAMEEMERFGVPRRIVAFVLPTGYSFNLDGSTLYLAVASVFVAQAAGVQMGLGKQLLMMLTLMLTSKGVAGVPRAGLVILSGALATFGLPLQGVAVIVGVDALMDMARTSINVVGNCLASAVMARWEGELGEGGAVPVQLGTADARGHGSRPA
ncbi:MAG TPA: dicarboxylate/amino acid:cation symporter [Gemmatimonadaceae bacterium]|nr:dicarboxylate/amino acid:cation symporter [Gemmatimonadaceae bacterium]